MFETYQMQEHICKELEKKAQSGIKSTTDLDTVWKLIDAYKNLLKIDMLQEAEEYRSDGGYSERRRRDSRGRYSREGGDRHGYEGDSSYNRGHSGYLHERMNKLREELQEMMSNANTREEREKIKDMLHEIGSLA